MPDAAERKKSRRRRLLNLLLGLILSLLVAVFVLLVLVTRPPGFYRRASERSPERLIADARSFNAKVQEFYSEQSSGRDFDVELTEDELSGYLAAANDDVLWEHLSLKLEEMRKPFRSRTLRNLQVSFRDGRVTVAGERSVAGVRVVMSLIGRPRLDDGRLVLNLEGIRAGTLPLPLACCSNLCARVNDRPFPSKTDRLRIESFALDGGRLTLRVKSMRNKP